MLQLPATTAQLLSDVIEPALSTLPPSMDSIEARAMLVAIAVQESNLADRRQGSDSNPGPARGLWQFERAGGTRGVLEHPSSDDLAEIVCRDHKVAVDPGPAHRRMEVDDLFACKFARLLLWTDPDPLPTASLASEDEAFEYYLWNWRPGAANTPAGKAKCAVRWKRAWRMAVESVSA